MQDVIGGSTLNSIFSDWSVAHVNETANTYTIQQPAGSTYRHHTAATWMTADGSALFALATNTGKIVFVKMPPFGIQGL